MLAWHRDIERAKSPFEVALMTRDYVSTLDRAVFARIPEGCRPGRILDESDIAALTARLTREYLPLRGTAADVGALQEMLSFFLRATVQIERLREKVASARERSEVA